MIDIKDIKLNTRETLPSGGGGAHVVRLNFKTSPVGVYKCLLLVVAISFYALSLLLGPCRLSEFPLAGLTKDMKAGKANSFTVSLYSHAHNLMI